MILTEEEAKTKRCQEGFGQPLYHSQAPLTTNDMAMGPMHLMGSPYGAGYAAMASPSHCIGSACMAWRWSRGEYDQGGQEIATHGYCGKAGRPDE
jgi:hypothetical protein